MVGAVAAAGEARAVGGVGKLGLGVGGSFGFAGVAAISDAVLAVAEPRASAIPAQGASKLASIAGAGLVEADHSETMISVSLVPIFP